MKIIALLLFGCAAAFAQMPDVNATAASPNLPLPKEPIVVRAPQSARWVISFGGNAGGDSKLVSVVKTGSVYHRETMRGGSVEMDQWWIRKVQVTRRKGDAGFLIAGAGSGLDSYYIDYGSSDFPEFMWISQKNYIGIQRYQNQDCFVFKSPVTKEIRDLYAEGLLNITSSSTYIVAWVDAQTRLPVALATDTGRQNYAFVAPPGETQTPPSAVAKEVSAWEAHSAAICSPAPKP